VTRLATAVGRALADHGITVAFGVLGNGNALAVAGLRDRGVRYIAARHEGGAIGMADAYYRATGNVAVCTTTYGPGLTNAATGLAEAVKHRSGVLVLCGDRPTDRFRPIDIDQGAFAAALGASTVRLTDPRKVQTGISEALWSARTGSCPVALSLPSDLLAAEVPDDTVADDTAPDDTVADDTVADDTVADDTVAEAPAAVTRPAPSAAGIEATLDMLAGARRPLLLAGLGAWRSGAAKSLMALGERLGALLTTTVMADGLFAESSWSLGICGGFSSPRAARIIRAADVVVAFGASLSDFTLHGGRMFRQEATVVQVDLRDKPTNDRVDHYVSGDATDVACALLDGATARGLAPAPWRAEMAAEVKHAGWEHVPYGDASTSDRIDPRTLSLTLAGLLPQARTLVLDGGHFVGWPAMYWPVPDPSALVFTGAAFQSVGLGFAGAVGAAVGRQDRTTIVALGDGGALMGLPELETLIRVAGSAIVVIYNDAAYGAEVHLYDPLGIDASPARFDDTDFAAVARSLGAEAVTVRQPDDLTALCAWRGRGAHGTFVLDCKVVPDVVATYLSDLRDHIRAGE
jgi:acetolactate synthase I/II/III large subunit